MARALHAGERRPCTALEGGRECGNPGRLFPRGWRCDLHRPKPAPVPDLTRTSDALQQRGQVRALQDAARAALRYYVDPEVLREALESVLRGHDLERV